MFDFMIASKLRKVFSRRRFAVLAAAIGLLLFAAYSIMGNVFVLGTLQPNPLGFNGLTVALMALLAAGGGVLAAVFAYARSFSRNTCAAGVAGGGLGLFASACAYCPPLLAYFLGAQSLYFLSAFGSALVLAAVVLMWFGVWKALEAV